MVKRKLLLISNSTNYGGEYLEHCADKCRDFLSGCKTVAFVPYALTDTEGYFSKVENAFKKYNICEQVTNVAQKDGNPKEIIQSADAVFVGGGNTFRLLKKLYDNDLVSLIRKRVFEENMRYMSCSAGTNVSCPTIRTTNDMPIVFPPSFNAIHLVPFQINPHFIDKNTLESLKHNGETREQRIQEFHEELENQNVPVIGLREGAMLWVEDDNMSLCGANGAKIFDTNSQEIEKVTGDDLSSYLKSN